MPRPDLTAAQRAMVDTWERHTAAEFGTKSVDATMATMTGDPVVNHVPVMTGGVGHDAVRQFYSTHFVPAQPPDVELIPLTRTVGTDRIVDELVYRFTHTIEMPWMLPGIAATGRRIEIPLVVIVEFQAGRISAERIYWDQASVLIRVGVLDSRQLPATGIEATRQVLDPHREPSNRLIAEPRPDQRPS
ncbi:MAG: nuclear transport factor 2 family protein [Gemmatimonadales bacterium]